MISRRRIIVAGASAGILSGVGRHAAALEQCPAPGMPPGTCSAMLDPNRFIAQETAKLQKQSQWCWAACISMVCNWHRFPLSQESIVKRVYGGLVNMPGDDRVLTSALNNVWEADDKRRFRITANVFSPHLGANDVSNLRVVNDLKDERPLINGSGTHATVVARVDYTVGIGGQPHVGRVHVIDPFPGQAAPPLHARFLSQAEMTPIQFGGSLRYLASISIVPV